MEAADRRTDERADLAVRVFELRKTCDGNRLLLDLPRSDAC